jgi:hypothetical protein
MAGVITTGNHPKALWPGMHAFFGLSYNEHPEEWKEVFGVEKSSKNYEEDTLGTGFGLASVKEQGAAVTYDSENQGYTKRYTHVVYGLGYVVTEEELEDNLYEIVSKRRIKRLSFSMRQTKEIVHALILDRAANSSYTGGDGKELLATDHPTINGNQSNELATAADFSEAALEDIIIQIGQAKNERGMLIALRPRKLIHPVNIQFDVARVLKSELTPDTANNAVNAVRLVGLKPVLNHYVTDTDQWFVQTDCPNGMTHYQRRPLTFAQDNDFDTANAKAKATMRFIAGWTDFRSMYGSPGA